MAESAAGNVYWQQFLASTPWFLQRGQTVEVGSAAPPGSWAPASHGFAQLFPEMERFLRAAFVSPAAVDGRRYQLYSWPRTDGGSCSWLSPLPPDQPSSRVHPDHRVLLGSFGGVVQQSNEPPSWIANHNDVLTEREARRDGAFLRDAWAFEEASAGIPIDVAHYYSIAREANGNTTLCHQLRGEVVLFAPDHAYRHVQPYPGCPEYTLYRIEGAATFRDWVNTVARQWHDSIRVVE